MRDAKLNLKTLAAMFADTTDEMAREFVESKL